MNNQQIITSKKYLLEDQEPDMDHNPKCLYKQSFEIPPYQRPYSWGKAQLHELLEDFLEAFQKNENNKGGNIRNDYYIGNIFCTPHSSTFIDENYKQIIDGQQRVTSVFLILVYLSNYFHDDYFLEKYNNIVRSFKFSMAYPDNDIIRQIRLYSTNDGINSFFKNRKLAMKVGSTFYMNQWKIFGKAFKTIFDFFKNNKFLNTNERKADFYKYISSHVFCLYIEDSPTTPIGHYLFSSLNGKGLKLDKIDLIKSFFVSPYMDSVDKIKKFNDFWGKLIEDSENDLKTWITSYFKKNNTKHISSEWLKTVSEKIKNEKNTSPEKEFESMCKWISGMRLAKMACTGNNKIDFWLTLFNIFPYKPALTIYGHIRSQFSDQEFPEKKVTDGISEVLEYIFKINYLFVTFLEGKPNAFQNQIIDPCIKITSNDEYKNYEKLSELKKFLETEFNNIISDESKRIKIDKFNINEYSYNGDKPLIKLLSVYKPIKNSETWDCHLNQIIYQHAKESLSSRKTLDHILHQSSVIFHPQDDPFEQETLYCFNKKKNLFEYNEKIITDELLDYFDVKTPISLDKEGYDEFKSKILDKAFNLRLMGDSANPQRGNKTIFNESEIREILDVQHIKFEMNLYNLAFKKFLGINEKFSKNPSDALKILKEKQIK